ncbi:FMRFamide-activated amiloride-sensitive sodium channel-like [Argopecten irradians]|uniref:FMRFamide-activated amiloride-sensitive sodium channel-like n=1 Tax=Argopecten irradians TaxID=31199 RepID=UPI00371BDA1E
MKFSAFGKLGRFQDQLRMVNHSGRRKNNSALAIIAELGSESNAHGLAKIATSTKTKRKVMWALLVIVGFTAATLQLSLLVRKYLLFHVVEVSEMKDGMPVEFPSVTICNTHAMSLTKVKERFGQNPDYGQWFDFLNRVSFGEQQTRVESTQGFYENMMSEATMVGHDINEILVHCQFNQQNCSATNFTKHFDGKNYFNCYTFNSAQDQNPNNKILMHATGPQNGLSMIISLDNDDPPLGAFGLYNIHDNIAHSAGIRVQVHAPNTMPSPVDHGFDVPPGFSSSVGLKAVMHTRLSSPHGNCTTDMLKGIKTYRNTIFSCLLLCKQKMVIKNCTCKSSGLPDTEDAQNYTYCGTIHNWQGRFRNLSQLPDNEKVNYNLNQLKCEEKILHELANDRSYERSCKCFQPCSETSYQKSLSLSYWPLEFYQFDALKKFYHGRMNRTFMYEAYGYLEEHIEKYSVLRQSMSEEDQMKMLTSNIPLEERQKLLRATGLIHQNLLRLNIYLEDLSVVEFKQMPAYELADLFADIGGTLGLWMGISVLTIMELMELVVRLIMLLFNAENKMPDHMDPVTNGMLDHTDNYPDAYQKTDFDGFDRNEYGQSEGFERGDFRNRSEGFERNDYGRPMRDNPHDLPI